MLSRVALLLNFVCVAVTCVGEPVDSPVEGESARPLASAPNRDDQGLVAELVPAEMDRTWTAQQVRDWAAAKSSTANLLDAESCAVSSNSDREDAAECNQIRLLQSVQRPLAAHQRNVSAAEALRVYYRIVGIERQRGILAPATEILDELIDLAERAEELGLPDGDPNALRRQQLELRIRDTEAEFGVKQLRVQLAQLTGRPRHEALEAELVDPLQVPSRLQEPQDAAADAVANRQDLQAIEILCRQINSLTLPAVRQLLAGLQPGLGMLAAAATEKISLLSLHGSKPDSGDLACRRRQCLLLQQERRSQIESEAYVAALDLSGLAARVELADQRVVLAQTAYQESERAVELDQLPLGSDKQRQLDWLKIRGEYVQLLMDTVFADVQLRKVRGVAHLD